MALSQAADQCDFYTQKSAQLQCDESGYLKTYGLKQCRKFLSKARRFSVDGQGVLQNIRSCLIDTLETTSNLSCSNVESIAVASHVQCYVDGGFCSLKMSDRLKVYWYLRHQINDPQFKAASFEIRRLCDFVFIKPTQL